MSQDEIKWTYPVCERCQFYDQIEGPHVGLWPLGVCRRFPPVEGTWPKVTSKDWCGEFRFA